MILKEYSEQIAALAALHPELEVVYSIDDEGNDFKVLHHTPSLGNYDKEEREWIDEQDFGSYFNEYDCEYEVNAVCIN